MQLSSGRRGRWFVFVEFLPPVALLITTTVCRNSGGRFCVAILTVLLTSFDILGGVPICSGGGVWWCVVVCWCYAFTYMVEDVIVVPPPPPSHIYTHLPT